MLYGEQVGISVDRFGPHSAWGTTATNAPDQDVDIAKVQEWLGHAKVSTTRVYNHCKSRPEGAPVFKAIYQPSTQRSNGSISRHAWHETVSPPAARLRPAE
jgi:integrase